MNEDANDVAKDNKKLSCPMNYRANIVKTSKFGILSIYKVKGPFTRNLMGILYQIQII